MIKTWTDFWIAVGIVAVFSFFAAIGWGWCANIYKLATQEDWKAPFATETLRIVGIPVAPVGIIMGYVK